MRRRLNSRAFDPVDEWLETQGLYRKQVARDGSCLFRAVAEQVFMTQTEHVRVRSLCLEYLMLYKDDFQPFLEVPLDHHVYKMQDVREWGGHTEIMAISHLFQVDFLIYQEIGRSPFKVTENNYPKTLMLSFTHGNHYDIVYKKEQASRRGFCQSLVYDILYSHVFQLKDVRLAVDTMLHDKEYASLRRDSTNSAEMREIGALVEKVLGTGISRDSSQDEADRNISIDERSSIEDIHPDDVRGLLAHGVPPFPYKVAKSLDPDIYRNIEFDAWNTVRRETRYGPYDSNGFQAGVKVLIKLELLPNRSEVEDMRRAHMSKQNSGENHNGKMIEEKINLYHGHIQEMSENKGPVDVFIEEIGHRLKVPYESLDKVPPSPPRSPWHASQQRQQTNVMCGGNATGGNVSSYKKLSGYYQKAPLPAEPEIPAGRSKKKGGKQVHDVLTIVQTPSAIRFCGPSNNTAMRGRSAGSPTPHGHSPRSRTPQGSSHPPVYYNPKSYQSRGMNRNNNSTYRNAPSPAREGFPSLSSGVSVEVGVEGVWAVRPNTYQSNSPQAPNAVHNSVPNNQRGGAYCPTVPQPPPLLQGDEERHQQMREVTLDALQQVMSAGGQQEVRVSGQQLEVVIIEKQEGTQHSSLAEELPSQLENNTPPPETEENVNDVVSVSREYQLEQSVEVNEPGPPEDDTNLQAETVSQSPSLHATNGEVTQPPVFQPDQNITYISPANIPTSQMGGSPSPHTAAMYTVNYPPPFSNPGLVQVFSPVPPADGNGTLTEYTPPSTTAIPTRPEGWDPQIQGMDSESMKMNQGMTPLMVYHVPVMYGGYGYGYNQPWTYSLPVMPTPAIDEGKQTPISGEGYQQMVAVGSWGPGYMGDYVPSPPLPGPPHQNYPPVPREPAPLPYPPPPYNSGREGNREGPPFPHSYHGRSRGGGPHHYNHHHHRGSYHNNQQYSNNYQSSSFQGMGRGSQRSLPPRFHRGGGTSPGRGSLRQFQNCGNPHQSSNTPPQHQRSHQYEGQPLMHMGSRKLSSESIASQDVSSGSLESGRVASPPLVPFVESDQPHGIMPLPPQVTPHIPLQEHMPMPAPPRYFTAPPGYVMSSPWMWNMM